VSDIDRNLWERHPYQLATIVVKDEKTQVELCRATVVAPVSSEINCAKCHNDDGIATKQYGIIPTGRFQTNIISLHDKLNRDKYDALLMDNRPVLCASCHASNALGLKGRQGLPSLSNAIHRRHQGVPEITPDTAGCYNCHPGSRTQFLRDTMSVNYKFNCTTAMARYRMSQETSNHGRWNPVVIIFPAMARDIPLINHCSTNQNQKLAYIAPAAMTALMP